MQQRYIYQHSKQYSEPMRCVYKVIGNEPVKQSDFLIFNLEVTQLSNRHYKSVTFTCDFVLYYMPGII